MHSSSSSEGPRLIRFAVLCAPTRAAIEIHSTAQSAARFMRPAQQAIEPRGKRETRSVLYHSLVVDSTA